jgi:hypothetical protein
MQNARTYATAPPAGAVRPAGFVGSERAVVVLRPGRGVRWREEEEVSRSLPRQSHRPITPPCPSIARGQSLWRGSIRRRTHWWTGSGQAKGSPGPRQLHWASLWSRTFAYSTQSRCRVYGADQKRRERYVSKAVVYVAGARTDRAARPGWTRTLLEEHRLWSYIYVRTCVSSVRCVGLIWLFRRRAHFLNDAHTSAAQLMLLVRLLPNSWIWVLPVAVRATSSSRSNS